MQFIKIVVIREEFLTQLKRCHPHSQNARRGGGLKRQDGAGFITATSAETTLILTELMQDEEVQTSARTAEQKWRMTYEPTARNHSDGHIQ